ncbi:site-specific integrase, partial [Heliophilum fasciatum]
SRFLRSSFYDMNNPDLKYQIDEFLKKNESSLPFSIFINCRAALYAYYKFSLGMPYPKRTKETISKEIEDLLAGFQEFQKSVKHLVETTILSETNQVRRFLNVIYQKSPKSFNVSGIGAIDICNYFTNDANHLMPSTKGRVATSLRNFFRYLRFSRVIVDESIFKLPLSPAVWKLSSIPTVLSDDEFQALPKAFDQSKPSGIRDYAIALSFTELGLRCVEVAQLTVDDFDWVHGIVTIKNTKNHIDRSLPISFTFGEAIVNYLQNARPASKSRVLFVRFSHVRGEPMGRSQVRGIMRRAYKRARFRESITGTHIIRRTVASKIYKKGASLKMVADILGHESLESTAIYTKIDTDVLIKAATIWPGGGSL